MLSYVFGQDLQRLQPLVLLGEDLYVKTRQEAGPVVLVSALGIVHPLRPLCPARTLVDHHQRINRLEFHHLLENELARRNVASSTDALVLFLQLAPAFLARDWDEEYRLPGEPPLDETAVSDLAAQFTELVEDFPVPQLPVPSLLALGRVWLCAEVPPSVSGRVHIRVEGTTLVGLTGEYMPVAALEREWRAGVRRYVSEAATQLAQTKPGNDSTGLMKAKDTLPHDGFLQVGDLLFLAGDPPRLGHVIPSHYNRTLGRQSQRDLAITAPLVLPPTINDLCVYQRNSRGGWEAFRLPHGLCLGAEPSGSFQDASGLAVAAYLRWAAVRIAGNRRFHEYDQ